MRNILMVYGGRSYEHDVSVISAVQIGELWTGEDRLVPVYMREGELWLVKDWKKYAAYTGKVKGKRATWAKGGLKVGGTYLRAAAALLVTHGGEGEDGTLEAVLDYYQIPYTACDTLTSAVCMDKIWCKRVLAGLGFPVVDGGEAKEGVTPPLPAVCKPARLGSSIGVGVARTEEMYRNVLAQAAAYDDRVLWERYVEGAKEYNQAALWDGNEIRLSAIERPAYGGDTYTFGEKYMRECAHELPAALADELREEIEKTTREVYGALGMRGVVRVDYLYDGEKLYVNEINTIPGSLSFRLFAAVGMPVARLTEVLVENARCAKEPKAKYGELLGELVGTYK